MYSVGNCLICAYLFKIFYQGEITHISHEIGEKGLGVKHYVLRTSDDQIVHFKRVCNILPWPLKEYLYIGKIEKITFNERR